MKVTKTIVMLFGALILGALTPLQTQAQWGIGGSYEIRDKNPENGFGARIERDILEKLPAAKLRLRAHFSYFNETNTLTSGTSEFSQEVTDYDFGFAGIAGVSVGLVTPYVGLGLGSNTVDLDYSNVPTNLPNQQLSDRSGTSLSWNGLIGAEVGAIPTIKPFVEYRFSQLSDEPIDFTGVTNSNGRIVFGAILRF